MNYSQRKMDPPKASVAIITYNQERFIGEAIESALNQETNFPYEIVISDDCSTDATRDIVKRYQSMYPNMVRLLLQSENIGFMNNFVDTLQACRGSYVALLEGDDSWGDRHKLQKQVNFLDANREYILCHHDAVVIDGDGQIVRNSLLNTKRKRDFSADEIVKFPSFITPTVCYRNVLLEIPPEFMEAKSGDVFLFSMLGLYGKAKYLGETIEPSRYRLHGGGVWSSIPRTDALLNSATTRYWISKFYDRIGKKSFARHFMSIYLHKVGTYHYLQGDNLQAIKIMLRALKQTPLSSKIWRRLLYFAIFYTKMGKILSSQKRL